MQVWSTNDKYALCLYFVVYTLGSIGYGDVTPATTLERYLAVCTMLTGSYFFGYIVGSITSIVSTRNSIKNAFYKTMDELHEFMEVSPSMATGHISAVRRHAILLAYIVRGVLEALACAMCACM